MDHFKLRVHDSGLYERVQVSAAQEFFPVFQKGGDMDGIGRDISRRIRSRAGTANVDLDSAILSRCEQSRKLRISVTKIENGPDRFF